MSESHLMKRVDQRASPMLNSKTQLLLRRLSNTTVKNWTEEKSDLTYLLHPEAVAVAVEALAVAEAAVEVSVTEAAEAVSEAEAASAAEEEASAVAEVATEAASEAAEAEEVDSTQQETLTKDSSSQAKTKV